MPQQWQKHWPLLEDAGNQERSADRREELIHTIGNLTLLTGKLNPALSNGPWDTKRPELLKHSALNLNRWFQEVETWNELAIKRRTRELLDLAVGIWAYPSPKANGASLDMDVGTTTNLTESSAFADEVDGGSLELPDEGEVGSDAVELRTRVRDNLQELVSEFADKEPLDFSEVFASFYPDDKALLEEEYSKSPRYTWSVYVSQIVERIVTSDPTLAYDRDNGGGVVRKRN